VQASYTFGTTVHLERAVVDLQKASKIEPTNASIGAPLAVWQHELLRQNRKDRRTFGNMFQRGNLYSEQEMQRGQIGARAHLS
jgi:hypothetical protein